MHHTQNIKIISEG